jgi:hypothetical protein
MTIDPRLHRIVAAQPYPLLFATISGAHVLPLEKVVGLDVRDETVEDSRVNSHFVFERRMACVSAARESG